MSERSFDLTIPHEGSRLASRVFAQSLARLERELRQLALASQVESPQLARHVERLATREPGALPALLRSPSLATLLRVLRARHEPATRAALRAELEALFFFELAVRGALDEPVTLTTLPRVLASPSTCSSLSVPADVRAATFEARRITFARAHRDLPGANEVLIVAASSGEAYRELAPGIVLASHDGNPLSLEEAHPDKAGNAVDFGGHDPDEWAATLTGALGLVAAHLPDLRRDLTLYAQQIVPVGWDAERHLSASYAEAIGTVYLSLHPDLMTMTEALIHESSHGKLNAFFEIDPVLENAFHPLYTSPVRPDPRPLHGVLLAVHAFLPVARLYERMIAARDPRVNDSFRERYRRVCQINAEGAEVLLTHGRPTSRGKPLLEEIRSWTGYYRERAS